MNLWTFWYLWPHKICITCFLETKVVSPYDDDYIGRSTARTIFHNFPPYFWISLLWFNLFMICKYLNNYKDSLRKWQNYHFWGMGEIIISNHVTIYKRVPLWQNVTIYIIFSKVFTCVQNHRTHAGIGNFHQTRIVVGGGIFNSGKYIILCQHQKIGIVSELMLQVIYYIRICF